MRGCVKGGRFLPGGSEPLTQLWICFIDHLEGEGPSAKRSRKFFRRAICQCGVRTLLVAAAPAFELFPCIREAEENFAIQALIAQPAI